MRESEEEKMRGGEAASDAGALHYIAETRGEENVGVGGRLRRLLLRERNSGATVWGRG